MSKANTVGRMVGQSPGSGKPAEASNPLQVMSQGLQHAQTLWQQAQGLAKLLGGGGGGGGGHGAPAQPQGPAASTGGDAPLRDLTDLQRRLTALGLAMRTQPGAMEGAPRPDQVQRRAVTDAIVQRAMQVGGPGVASAHELDLARLREEATALAASLPTPAQGAQALDAAETLARMRGAGGPTMQVIQQVLGVFQQALSVIAGGRRGSGGAQVRGE